ncbi:hypothetical protein AS159_07180 [Thermotoga sp. Ku-13t]|uniref:anaerobic ribonucleoside-triphosphate reductase activating protein n=1 Tax=Thermotoga sp. Ku-13t TaxID=1755813 RepID=UPI0016981325|nr:anaerobic ribonucleoside-triphosphate reductase activating protein [Thermotoga sp. Ku-13t]KAF2957450.1 hypothetical protein AS159_07180 [Thermotoga sp. Ku-13t]
MFARMILTSLLDYPKSVSSVVFTVGCNFRCPYCHNPELVLGRVEKATEDEILEEIRRRTITNRVVITGGEPTIHEKLLNFVRILKEENYLVKLDTNGSNPELVEQLLKEALLDYVALDFKAGAEHFHSITGLDHDTAQDMFENVLQTLNILKKCSIPHEVRTTYVPGLMNEDDLAFIGKIVGGSTWYLQRFRAQKTLKPLPGIETPSDEVLHKLASRFGALVR